MSSVYASKVQVAEAVLRYSHSKAVKDMEEAEMQLKDSFELFQLLTSVTRPSYHFANSMQTGHRKIPFPGAANDVGTNYHWTQVLPLYEKELADFRGQVAELKRPKSPRGGGTNP